MKLTSDNETLAENKVLILYILNKIGKSITNDNLYKLTLAIQEMNYFYFQQFLLDLLENKYIVNYEKDEESVYEITPYGREILVLTKDMVPGIIQLKIENYLNGKLEDIQEKESITSEFIPKSENEFIVKCKIVENNETVFEVKTKTTTRQQAIKIIENWDKNANIIYPKILENLYM